MLQNMLKERKWGFITSNIVVYAKGVENFYKERNLENLWHKFQKEFKDYWSSK